MPHLSILGGKVDLDNLQVSPCRRIFRAPHIFTLGGIAVGVHYSELTSTPIHIQQIIIDHPVLVVQQSNIQLNLQALMKQMPQTPKTSSGQETQPIKLVIDDLTNGAQVTLMLRNPRPDRYDPGPHRVAQPQRHRNIQRQSERRRDWRCRPANLHGSGKQSGGRFETLT